MKTISIASLFALLAALPVQAAEECLAKDMNDVGRCTASTRGKADKRVSRAQSEPPDWLNTSVLSLQLFGLTPGEINMIPVQGGKEWLLIAGTPERDESSAQINAALLQISPASGNAAAQVRVLARGALTNAGDGCASPLNEDAPITGYFMLSTQRAAWLRLGKQRVLRLDLNQMEGYAGGGKTFAGEALYRIDQATLRKVACYQTYSYAMLGGEWNPDGTRQHPVSQANWRMQPVGGKTWPDLHLQPLTRKTAGMVLVWDVGKGQYREKR